MIKNITHKHILRPIENPVGYVLIKQFKLFSVIRSSEGKHRRLDMYLLTFTNYCTRRILKLVLLMYKNQKLVSKNLKKIYKICFDVNIFLYLLLKILSQLAGADPQLLLGGHHGLFEVDTLLFKYETQNKESIQKIFLSVFFYQTTKQLCLFDSISAGI